jgi:hypothetical protein
MKPKTIFLGFGAVVVAWGHGKWAKPGSWSMGSFVEDGFTIWKFPAFMRPFYEAGVVKCEDVICWSDAGSCGHCGVARGLVQLSIQAYTVAGLESLAGIVPGAVVLVHFVQGTDAHLG